MAEWALRSFSPAEGPDGAVNFLNQSARQGLGEVTATVGSDGSVELLYLTPGSLGDSTAQSWAFRSFSPAEGPDGAVNFLNQSARQGLGEVSATVGSDGSVGLFFLTPGSLGDSTAQSWAFRSSAPGEGPGETVNFLNQPARQGRGEAVATVGSDGSVELFFLTPGSLGDSTAQSWAFRSSAPGEGPGETVNFLNQPARQGHGEASATVAGDGSVSLFYLTPGTG